MGITSWLTVGNCEERRAKDYQPRKPGGSKTSPRGYFKAELERVIAN